MKPFPTDFIKPSLFIKRFVFTVDPSFIMSKPMSYVIRGQWGLNREGFFQNDPWYLVENSKIIHNGFGKPPGGYRMVSAGAGIIIPGLVNSHTHIELSYLKNKATGGKGVHEFAASLMQQARPSLPFILETAKLEVEKARLRGTFFFADISNNPEFILSMKESLAFRGIRFLELLGFSAPFDQHRISMADSMAGTLTGKNENGIYFTPHSIYGSSPEIMKYVQNHNVGIASIHALEEPGELDLFSGKGPTFDFLQAIGQYRHHLDFNGQSYVSYLEKFCSGFKKFLLVHLTYADDPILKSIELKLPLAAIVLCIRSNVFLGYERSNWSSIKNSSLPLLLGTDSVASCPDLSILDELINLIGEDRMPVSLLWQAATFTAYDYFEISASEIPWYLFPGTTPDISTFATVPALNILEIV